MKPMLAAIASAAGCNDDTFGTFPLAARTKCYISSAGRRKGHADVLFAAHGPFLAHAMLQGAGADLTHAVKVGDITCK